MNEAIRLAIDKGGYSLMYPNRTLQYHRHVCTQDPLFWKSLGKVLGWKDYGSVERLEALYAGLTPKDWKTTAHRYLKIKLTGGDEEQFWKNLLK